MMRVPFWEYLVAGFVGSLLGTLIGLTLGLIVSIFDVD